VLSTAGYDPATGALASIGHTLGRIAARALGARRLTYDVDCLPASRRDNLDRLTAAMRELQARLRGEGLGDTGGAALPVQLSGATLARTRISIWRTDAGDLDTLAEIPDLGPDDRAAALVEFASRNARWEPIV